MRDAKLFERVGTDPSQPEPLILHTEMRAFCAQVVGFIFNRVAGISAFRFKITDGGTVIFADQIEQVVTDADEAYSGSHVTTVEQAMRRAMADSLRLVLGRFLAELEASLQRTLLGSERATGEPS